MSHGRIRKDAITQMCQAAQACQCEKQAARLLIGAPPKVTTNHPQEQDDIYQYFVLVSPEWQLRYRVAAEAALASP